MILRGSETYSTKFTNKSELAGCSTEQLKGTNLLSCLAASPAMTKDRDWSGRW